MNLELVASLRKPPGFFDPQNPGEYLPEMPEDEDDKDDDEDDEKEWSERSAMLSFSNTDIAFSGDVMVTGSYHGFNIYRLQEDGMPNLLSSVVCPGGQGDVSIVGDLLFMSVQETRARIDCGLGGISEDVSTERFRGLRIIDISDLTPTSPASMLLPILTSPPSLARTSSFLSSALPPSSGLSSQQTRSCAPWSDYGRSGIDYAPLLNRFQREKTGARMACTPQRFCCRLGQRCASHDGP